MIDFKRFANEDEGLGEFTLDDIRAELELPGRDPRPEFKAPEWRDDIQSLEDLKAGHRRSAGLSVVWVHRRACLTQSHPPPRTATG